MSSFVDQVLNVFSIKRVKPATPTIVGMSPAAISSESCSYSSASGTQKALGYTHYPGYTQPLQQSQSPVFYSALGSDVEIRGPRDGETTFAMDRGQVIVWPDPETYQADAVPDIWNKQRQASCSFAFGNYPIHAEDSLNPMDM
jgi:hypothetical protein